MGRSSSSAVAKAMADEGSSSWIMAGGLMVAKSVTMNDKPSQERLTKFLNGEALNEAIEKVTTPS